MSKQAMTLALEALNVAEHFVEEYAASKYYFAHIAAKTALEEALAKQEQGEPFGWYDMEHGEIRDVEWNRQKPTYEGVWRPLYTTPPQSEARGLSQQPAQKPWVGLTDEDEIDWEEGGSLKDLVKAIEAKLKEKNT